MTTKTSYIQRTQDLMDHVREEAFYAANGRKVGVRAYLKALWRTHKQTGLVW